MMFLAMFRWYTSAHTKSVLILLSAMVLNHEILYGNGENTQEFSCVYVQATQGSFNHQAIELLLNNEGLNAHIEFCGTPLNTFKTAFENGAPAFTAIRNTIIPGNYVEATIKALHEFQIENVIATVLMKIELAHLRHRDAVANGISPAQIASHPAALQQISKWKSRHPGILQIEIHEGTGEAARLLSTGELPIDTSVVGPITLVNLYPNLVIVEEGIQDSESNVTTFLLAELVKRTRTITDEEIVEELQQLIPVTGHSSIL